jgi:hypothetical protein
MNIKDDCNQLRDDIRRLGERVKALKQHDFFENVPMGDSDPGEMKANIMLAYRHLEDSRMRIGKVIQSLEGGISIFDKPK